MKVFIPRIPMPTTRAELKHFVEDEINSWFHLPFTDEPKILNSEILEIAEQNGVRDHHGLVTVTPDSAGKKLIDHLSGKRIHGKQVFLREYIERKGNGSAEWEPERRRDNLNINKVNSPHVEGYENANHTFGDES